MRKEDKSLKLKEKKFVESQLNNKIFLTIDQDYQCGNCLHIFPKKDKCPKCGTEHTKRINQRNMSYEQTNYVEIYRKQDDTIINLLFMIYDRKQQYAGRLNKITRNYYLVRKTVYNEIMTVHVNSKFYYNSWANIFAYSGAYQDNFYTFTKREKGVLKYKSPASIIYNQHLLKELPSFKYIIIPERSQDIELCLLYPKVIEILQKTSKREDLYSSIKTIVRYKDTYKRYNSYFERYGNVKASLLIRLSKYKQMLVYKDFERLMQLGQLPKGINTFKDLVDCSKLGKHKYFNNDIYKDYLRQMVEEGQDITLNNIRFNPEYRSEHDRIVNKAKLIVAKKKEKKFLNKYVSFKDFTKKGISIIVPKQVDDLFEESEQLDHCIKTYVDRVTAGECLVFFVREAINKPFITVEVKNKKIVQMRGKHNEQDMILPIHKKVMREYLKSY